MKQRLDPLIAERAPWLASGRFPTLRRALDHLLRYPETVRLAEICRNLPPSRILAVAAAHIATDTTVAGLEHLPRSGPAIIVANHPTGIADGIILNHLIAPLRPDLFFFANSDILRVFPQMEGTVLPVEWRKEKRSREGARRTLAASEAAFAAGRVGVIFPSGRLAQRRGLSLHERPWMSSAASLARKFGLPLVPVQIRARNSALFYLLDAIHPTLRDITLFHEVLNKDRQPYRVTMGRAIRPGALPAGADAATLALRDAVLCLGEPRRRPSLSLLGTSRAPRWLEPLSPLP
ncbi:MAG: 1-acyl-sn-glycerol-3-phosphate acyltransferase [Pseudorhodobacter sp.]